MSLKWVFGILLTLEGSHARLAHRQLIDKVMHKEPVSEFLPLRPDSLNGDLSETSRIDDDYWLYFYEKTLFAHNVDGGPMTIGTSANGEQSTAAHLQAYVSKIQMYIDTIKYNDDFFGDEDFMEVVVGISVEFSDGSVEEYGRKDFVSSDITFEPGETIKGDITVCGTGLGTGVGYYGFETSTGQKFEAGKTFYDGGNRDQYRFDADGHVLTGFFVKHDPTMLLAIGTKVMHDIESVAVYNVEYQGFVDNAEIPVWNVERQVDSKISGDNSGTYTVSFQKAQESLHSFESELTNFMKTTLGTKLSVTVAAEVPGISVESTLETSFQVEMGTSSTVREMESLTEVERFSQDIEISFEANRITETTIMQAEYPLTYNWIGKQKYKFKDDSELIFNIEGTYSGVLVSELEVSTKATCLDGSEVISGSCPGDPNLNCRFGSFQTLLKKMKLIVYRQ